MKLRLKYNKSDKLWYVQRRGLLTWYPVRIKGFCTKELALELAKKLIALRSVEAELTK